MADLLIQVGQAAVLVFVVCQMAAMGLELTVPQILAPLKNLRVVVPALIVNFVVVPCIALALVAVLPLPQGYAYGLIILGCAAGAPFLPTMVQMAKGDVGFAVGLMVLLMVATTVYLPVVLPLLITGVAIHPWEIAEPLVVLILIPLGIALLVRSRLEAVAKRLAPYFARVTSIALVVLFVAYLAAYLPDLAGPAGAATVVASLVFLLAAFAAGYLAGGPGAATRKVVGLGTALRYSSAAAVGTGCTNAAGPPANRSTATPMATLAPAETLETDSSGIQDAIDGLDDETADATGALGSTATAGDETCRILSDLARVLPAVIDATAVSKDGVMLTVEPAAYASFRGTGISDREQMQRLVATYRPLMSQVYATVEGVIATDLEHPVFALSGQFDGSASLLFSPSTRLTIAVQEALANRTADLFVLDPNGIILYDTAATENGGNVSRTRST